MNTCISRIVLLKSNLEFL